MTSTKPASKNSSQTKVDYPGMMGDGTEEQNLGQQGDPASRIEKKDVEFAFGKKHKKTSK